jgi:predicted exporter
MTKRFLACAGLLTLAFLACHIAGLRQATCILCGTYPATGSVMAGLMYAGVYMTFTILAPILALGAGVAFLLDRGLTDTKAQVN